MNDICYCQLSSARLNLNVSIFFLMKAVQGVTSGDVQVSYAQKRCDADQSYSSLPSDGALLTLTPNGKVSKSVTDTI